MPRSIGRRFFMHALALISGAVFFVWPQQPASAAVPAANQIVVASTKQSILTFGGSFAQGQSLAVADVTGDGPDEYIVGAGPGGGPQIEVYSQTGDRLRSFFSFDKKMSAGLCVGAGALQLGQPATIAVGAQAGGPSDVELYNLNGVRTGKFTAFESSYTGGVNVAVLAATEHNAGAIVVGSGTGREPEVRVFDASGQTLLWSWQPFGKSYTNGVAVAAGWSPTFGQPVIIVGAKAGQRPDVQVYGLNSRTLLASWLAYDAKVKTGLSLAYANDTVVTGAGPGAGPEARVFSLQGSVAQIVSLFDANFHGGIVVGYTLLNGRYVIVGSAASFPTSPAANGKRIEVSLSKQELRLFENGQLLSVHRVSTGKWSAPTPIGSFQTRNKIPVAYSRAYGLYMEWWMAITPDGKVGLHALPFWKLKNGGKLYEGAAHIGTPVSHGCIRQTLADAKALFDWAPIGTPVVVQS
ncbi:MAG: L,D-transpeptidase family protein [Candidatus Kerfeldbacteria bacterium]|nr:L,D-transpeptidase family protein [Candidatus Kerfeldbacteria bacterium]